MRIEQGYSVAVNFRVTNGAWSDNLKMAITRFIIDLTRLKKSQIRFIFSVFYHNRGWPIGFLVREVLEVTNNYAEAVEQLSQSELIAPCYFTICGTKQSSTLGTLLTRRRKSEDKRYMFQYKYNPIVEIIVFYLTD